MSKNIKLELMCKNIAPLHNLNFSTNLCSLKIGLFANNGSGKTYLSRAFRLIEGYNNLYSDEFNNTKTNGLISFGEYKSSFKFKITDGTDIKENIQINLQMGEIAEKPLSKYIYHTFNQDYVDDNIKALNFVKNETDDGMDGYILGKDNIDISEENKKLKVLKEEGCILKSKLEDIINLNKEKINKLPRISTLQAYSNLAYDKVVDYNDNEIDSSLKTVDEYLGDYNKIKSVPENLTPISDVLIVSIDFETIDNILHKMQIEYSLAKFSEEFKKEFKSKSDFINNGLNIYNNENSDKNICPFCKQDLKESALHIIDDYNRYVNDTEAKIIHDFQNDIKYLQNILEQFSQMKIKSLRQSKIFYEYKNKYFSSFEGIEVNELDINDVTAAINDIIKIIKDKIDNISNNIKVSNSIDENLRSSYDVIKKNNDENNNKTTRINKLSDNIKKENLNIRNHICYATFNSIVTQSKTIIEEIIKKRSAYTKLEKDIREKESKRKKQKKDAVAETIEKVLKYFFNGEKYNLDKDNFNLVFNKRTLQEGEAKEVLSEGEKNIIAFAYYIGDAHLKINKDEDYDSLFFIIDDPISSMDYNYVYTVSGVIKHLKNIFPQINKSKYIIMTHNNDFMRIISSNKIVETKLLLHDGKIQSFNQNFTVPYLLNLIDIYIISRKDGHSKHTTANSIRHIIETLVKFENVDLSDNSIDKYLTETFDSDSATYTLINDLSHGGLRDEQLPIDESQYKQICDLIINKIEGKYPMQVDFCRKQTESMEYTE